MVSNLTDSYWAKHFALVRRLEAPVEQTSYLPSSPSLRVEGE
jgi:hypothetical protein